MKNTVIAFVSVVITALLLQYIWFHNWGITLFIIFTVVFHEAAHVAVLLRYGVKPMKIYVVPLIGAAVTFSDSDMDRLNFEQRIMVYLVGPLSNIFLAIAGGMVFLFLPEFKDYGIALAGINITFALANLLPFNILDGGKVTQILFKNLDENDGIKVASRISLAVFSVWAVITVSDKLFSFLPVLIMLGLAKSLWDSMEPEKIFPPEMAPKKTVTRLAAIFGMALITTLVAEAAIPNWLGLFHIWPAK
jgi:Zn-dependent protease